MAEFKYLFFAIGTVAFFVAVFLSIRHPELVESPGELRTKTQEHPLRRWDRLVAWVMWGGWGVAALLFFLEKNKLLGAD